MKKLLAFLLAMTVLFSVTGCTFLEKEDDFDVDECLEEAEELVDEGKLEEAEKLLKKAIRKTNDNEELWEYLERVQAMMDGGRLPQKETAYDSTAPLSGTEATQQPTSQPQQPQTPVIDNMLDDFDSNEMRKINVFLSNFSEQRFKGYPCDELAMVKFAYRYIKVNNRAVLGLADSEYYVKGADMDSILKRFFGKTVNGAAIPANNEVRYSGGVYYFPAADGESFSYCTVATNMVDNGDGTYTVTFNNYQHINPHEGMGSFYSMTAAQADASREITQYSSGTAVVRDYTRSDGQETYQLISYELD